MMSLGPPQCRESHTATFPVVAHEGRNGGQMTHWTIGVRSTPVRKSASRAPHPCTFVCEPPTNKEDYR